MAKTVFRLALLLAVTSIVGIAGLNSSADPTRIRSASAANLNITLTSNQGNSLDFSISSIACPENMVGGDTCTATVVATALVDGVTMAEPTVSVSGVLETCTGPDKENPQGGGDNLDASIENLSFTPDVTEFDDGEAATFDVVVTLSIDVENACQGKEAEITVRLNSTSPDAVIGESPTPTPTPTLTNQVQNTQATPTPTRTPISETLPSRLPLTGSGGQESTAHEIAKFIVFGTGAVAALMLMFAVSLWKREADE